MSVREIVFDVKKLSTKHNILSVTKNRNIEWGKLSLRNVLDLVVVEFKYQNSFMIADEGIESIHSYAEKSEKCLIHMDDLAMKCKLLKIFEDDILIA